MKRIFALCVVYFFTVVAFAQQKPTELDKSPLDISYFPQNYPILKMNGKASDAAVARVIYSRPQKGGRQIFGGIIKYGDIWRMGANEATEIDFFKAVKINGKSFKGRYSVYAICNEDKWTIILNQEKDVWGVYYNQKKDVARFDVPVQKTNDAVEVLTIYFDTAKTGANLNFLWDNVKVSLPVLF